MSVKSIFKDCKMVPAADYASGTTDVKGPTAGVDTKGFDTIEFVLHVAAVATGATTSVKLQHSDDTTDGNFADIAGTSQTIADDDDNQLFVLSLEKPVKRYVRLYIDKDATNAVGASAVAYLSNAETKPVTQPTGVQGEFFVSPASGTA